MNQFVYLDQDSIKLTYYKSGKLYSIENKINGELRKFYTSGQLKYHNSGLPDNIKMKYYESGKIEYIKNKVTGEYKLYYDSGQLKYHNSGLPNNIIKEYFKTGKLKYHDSGLPNNIIKEYFHPTGKKKSIKNQQTGVYKEFYKNGQLKLFNKGLPDNIIEHYSESGILQTYDSSFLDGIVKYYYVTGQLYHTHNQTINQDTYYYESGEVSRVFNQISGEETYYYKSGQIQQYKSRTIQSYIDSHKSGSIQSQEEQNEIHINKFNESGQLIEEIVYNAEITKDMFNIKTQFILQDVSDINEENDYLNYKITTFYDSGQIKSQILQKDVQRGLSYSIQKNYYESGQLQRIQEYSNCSYDQQCYSHENKHKLDLKYEYYESGQIKLEINGQGTQVVKQYYENGQIQFEIPYIDFVIEGQQKEYYESGQLKKQTQYNNNKKNGQQYEYDINGNLKQQLEYKNGIRYKEKQYFIQPDLSNFDRCSICLTDKCYISDPVALKCDSRHIFCRNCILLNIKRQYKVKCPICKSIIQ